MPTRMIPIDRIEIPGGKNREKIDPDELKGMAETMKKRGQLQAIAVRPVGYGAADSKDGKFTLVAGERRLRAAKLLKWHEIECTVQDLDDEAAAELRLIENTQRVPLTAWEEADQVSALDPALSLEEVGLRLGQSPRWVAVRRAIGKLIPALKALVREQDWPQGHLPLLARFPPEQQPAILEAIQIAQQTEWYSVTIGEDENQRFEPTVPSYRELLEFLDEYLRLLSSAPWNLKDAELLPKAGACNVCPKRSSAQSLLFPELADAKSDRCLDEGCWEAKQAALIALNVNKLSEKGAAPVLLKGHQPVKEEVMQALGPVRAIENSFAYTECKKNTPGAVPAVMVSGNEAGQVKYVRPLESFAGDAHEESNGSASGATTNGKHRPVDQQTGKPLQPTTAERLHALRLKRQCRACELWSEKLDTLKPVWKGYVDLLLVWFGTWEKRPHRLELDWDELARHKANLTVDAWAQLLPVFRSRLMRQGPMTQGAAIWKEALSQSKALNFPHVLEQCWKQAVDEIGLTKALKEEGVKDDVSIPGADDKPPVVEDEEPVKEPAKAKKKVKKKKQLAGSRR